MADLPNIQRQIATQPIDSSSGVADALLEFSSTIQPNYNPLTEVAGKWGQQMAQTASNEQARIAGIEAAKNPGQKFFPAIGESDAEFQKAYRYEVKQNSLFEGSKLLSALGNTAIQSPTSQSLAEYQKNAESGIQKILDNVNETDRPEVSRQLLSSYLGNYQKIENAVQRRNQEFMVANRASVMSQRGENIQNFALDGNYELAEIEYANGIASIDEGEELFKNGSPTGISPDDAAIQRKKLRERLLLATAQGKARAAAQEGKSEEFLSQLRTERPDGVNAAEHEMMVHGAGSYLNQYEAALSGQRQINYIGYDAEISNGTMTPDKLEEIRQSGKVSEIQMAKLEANFSSVSAKEQKAAATFNIMNGQADDPVAMANYSAENIDNLFQTRLAQLEESQGAQPGELGVQGETIVAQSIKAPIRAYQNRMEAGINSGDPEKMAIWSKAMIAMDKNNPVGMQGLNKDARSVGNLYEAYSGNTPSQGEKAAEKALNDVYNVDDTTRVARGRQLDQWYKDKDYNNATSLKNHIASEIGSKRWFSKNLQYPDRLTEVYNRLMPSYVMRNGNPTLADEELMSDLRQIYKDDNENGPDEIRARPSRDYLPDVMNWRVNDKVRALKEFVDSQRDIVYNGGFAQNEVSWKDAPDTTYLLTEKPLADEGNLVIQVNGKDRKVIVVSDDVTLRAPDNQVSWAFQYLDDNGIPQPLLDARYNNSQARWHPQYERLELEKKQYENMMIQKAYNKRQKYLENDFFKDPVTGEPWKPS